MARITGDHNQIRTFSLNVSRLSSASTDCCILIADRDYTLVAAKACWTVASDGGGNGVVRITKASSGTAPASGTAMTSNLSTETTANTPTSFTLVAGATDIAEGQMFCLDVGGTLTSLANVCITVQLLPAG